ncbi:MAG: serine/threonine protein kinase [Dactylosporangium sp.]|nr:serine/threonine protein kinase [Dactylosporangium sp.]NNJ61239.1 serine/threonine protein kinase [Dactylosporangium sp.]
MSGQTAAAPEIAGYRYVEPLGSGGFADVFRYERLVTEAHVAVKVLRGEAVAEDVRQQLISEARAMGRLTREGRHPHIATVDGIEWIGDRPCLIMEYCPGGSLADQLGKRRRFAPPEVLKIGVQIAGALQTAHTANIVHRDIKPGNIMFDRYDEPRLADFGIAALTADEAARASEWFSVHYAAPEVLDGPGDERSDLWALAATLYELLADRPPFKAGGEDNRRPAVERRIRSGDIPAFDRVDVPEELLALLRAAMTRDPGLRARRIGSAREFARRLQEIERRLGYPVTDLKGLATTDQPGGARAEPVAEPPADREPSGPPPPGTWGASGEAAAWRAVACPDSTVLRTAPGEVVGAGTVGRAARPTDRRRWLVGLVGVLVIAVSTAVVWGVFGAAGPRHRPAGTSESAEARDADALVDPDGIVPVPIVEARRLAAGSVMFTWRYDNPADGDFFQVTRFDVGTGQPVQVEAPEWLVRPGPAERPCVDVVVVRHSGRASQPGRACAP